VAQIAQSHAVVEGVAVSAASATETVAQAARSWWSAPPRGRAYGRDVVECPGCGAHVSEWAASCARCGGDLADAELVRGTDEPGESAAPVTLGPHRLEGRWTRIALGALALGAVSVAFIALSRVTDRDDAGSASSSASAAQTPSDEAGPNAGLIAYVDEVQRHLRVADLAGDTSTVTQDGRVSLDVLPILVGRSFVFVGDGTANVVVEHEEPGNPRFGWKTLGAAEQVLPSDNPDELWLVRRNASDQREVVLVDLDGHAKAPAVALPPTAVPIVAVADGLLVENEDAVVRLFDPQTQSTSAGLGVGDDIFDVRGSTLVWRALRSACPDYRCPLSVSELTRTDNGIVPFTRAIDVPAGTKGWARGGAISPDGKSIAAFVDVSPFVEADRSGPGAALVIVDVATGAVSDPIPGSVVAVGEPTVTARWSPTSDWLFFSGIEDSMHAYKRGTSAAVPLAIPASYAFAAS
jgi:hypothetical protein